MRTLREYTPFIPRELVLTAGAFVPERRDEGDSSRGATGRR